MAQDTTFLRRTPRARPEPIVFEVPDLGVRTMKDRARDGIHLDDRPRVGPWYVIWSEEGDVLCTIPLSALPRRFPKTTNVIPEPVREFARLLSRAACRCGRCHRGVCRDRTGRVTVLDAARDTLIARVPLHCIANTLWIIPEFNGMYWTARIRDKFGITV